MVCRFEGFRAAFLFCRCPLLLLPVCHRNPMRRTATFFQKKLAFYSKVW